MKYLVVSTAVTDDIVFPDGRRKEGLSGGAGIYALSGIKVWTDEVMIVTGVGRDYLPLHGEWFARNRLATAGLTVKGEHTPRTTVQYFADGEREETPRFGLDHYRTMEPTPADLSRHCAAAAGVYIFKNAVPAFWEAVFDLKKRHGFKLMWEIAADAATPENYPQVATISRHVDVFSINREEAFHLFATRRTDEVVGRLRALNLPLVFLRRGKETALLITNEKTYQAPVIRETRVVDATGGGNSSSGAVLYGFCAGEDPLMAGIMGSISAGYSISQFGPPPLLDEELRGAALRLAAKTYRECREGHNANQSVR